MHQLLFSHDDLLKTKRQTWFVTCIIAQLLSCQHFWLGVLQQLYAQNKKNETQHRMFDLGSNTQGPAWQSTVNYLWCLSQNVGLQYETKQKSYTKQKYKWLEDEISSVWSLSGVLNKCIFFFLCFPHWLCSLDTNITVRVCNDTVLCTWFSSAWACPVDWSWRAGLMQDTCNTKKEGGENKEKEKKKRWIFNVELKNGIPNNTVVHSLNKDLVTKC